MTQQGDVLLFQTPDGGDIIIENGIVAMSGGLETTVYLSLFGGNEDDDGRPDNPKNWWGNLDEIDPAKQYRSETQHLLQAIPATSGNLRKIEDAVKRDLAWMVTIKAASEVVAEARLTGVNRVTILIEVLAQGEESSFEFTQNWKVAACVRHWKMPRPHSMKIECRSIMLGVGVIREPGPTINMPTPAFVGEITLWCE